MSASADAPVERSTVRAMAPVIVLAANWAARKGLAKGYEATTGRPAPRAAAKEPSLVSKVLWAAAMAGVVVLVESLIWKVVDAFDDDPQDQDDSQD